jgi:hypothetical protein
MSTALGGNLMPDSVKNQPDSGASPAAAAGMEYIYYFRSNISQKHLTRRGKMTIFMVTDDAVWVRLWRLSTDHLMFFTSQA